MDGVTISKKRNYMAALKNRNDDGIYYRYTLITEYPNEYVLSWAKYRRHNPHDGAINRLYLIFKVLFFC